MKILLGIILIGVVGGALAVAGWAYRQAKDGTHG